MAGEQNQIRNFMLYFGKKKEKTLGYMNTSIQIKEKQRSEMKN